MYNWITLLYIITFHNIVNPIYFNKKVNKWRLNKKKKKEHHPGNLKGLVAPCQESNTKTKYIFALYHESFLAKREQGAEQGCEARGWGGSPVAPMWSLQPCRPPRSFSASVPMYPASSGDLLLLTSHNSSSTSSEPFNSDAQPMTCLLLLEVGEGYYRKKDWMVRYIWGSLEQTKWSMTLGLLRAQGALWASKSRTEWKAFAKPISSWFLSFMVELHPPKDMLKSWPWYLWMWPYLEIRSLQI